MFAEAFEYHAPATVEEAVGLLGQYGDDAKVITGGMSLIPLMKLRLAAPKHLIDLRKISGMTGVSESGGHLEIGARTTHYALESSNLLQSKCPLVAQAASEIGVVTPMVVIGTVTGATTPWTVWASTDPDKTRPPITDPVNINLFMVRLLRNPAAGQAGRLYCWA